MFRVHLLLLLPLVLAAVAPLRADQPGLVGIQYGSGDFERAQRLVTLEKLDKTWGDADGYGNEWSARWNGSLKSPKTGRVTILLVSDRNASISIGDRLQLSVKGGRTSGQISLKEGELLPVELTFRKVDGGRSGNLKVLWNYGNMPPKPLSEHLSHSLVEAERAKKEWLAGEQPEDDDEDREDKSLVAQRERQNDPREFPESDGIDFHRRAGAMDITVDGKLFATYVWSDPKTTRPYFKQIHHPASGTRITRQHPPQAPDYTDHETYHPGIWWGFGDVGGNDYWRMKTKIVGGAFLEEPIGDKTQGGFTVRNSMLTKDGQKFCDQICRYKFIKQDAGILMICESTFIRKKSDFWLGDQEEMGLACRVTKSICVEAKGGGAVRDSEGRTELKAIRTNQSDWANYSGPVNGKHGGVLLMNDPSNFRKPWWHAVGTGLLVANAFGESELNGNGKKRENVLVMKGQPFRVRYGALIHLTDEAEEFDPASAYKQFVDHLEKLDAPAKEKSFDASELPAVPDGFVVSVFASEPQVYKPTAICFDGKGRLMVGQGPQYPRNKTTTPPDSVYILTDTNGDGVCDESKAFATGFNSVQGLAWKGDALYVANAPELTIVRDLDGDDEADEYTVLYTDLGNREHALHGLNFGPDGKLYMSKGNSKGHNQPEKFGGIVAPKPFRDLWDVEHPVGAPESYPPKTYSKHSYRKTYHHWSDDWGREGGVLRCDPNGKNLEIVARGMRNPWDITMDDGFNWLGTDNDQDQGDRLIMPFLGAHFGWGHNYSSHWTGDAHLPTAPISGPVFHGSGTGIVFYGHNHFPSQYRNVFFVNDWMQGTFIYRPTWEGALMQPAGGRWERFAARGKGGMLYRPTDIELAPDGSLYICGWGGDYHYDRSDEGSWLFRIRYKENASDDEGEYLESNKRETAYSDWSVEQLIADLTSATIPVWRVAAQDELVRRGELIVPKLRQAVESNRLSTSQETWVLWAIGRISNAWSQQAFICQLAAPTKNGLSAAPLNQRIQAIRILATFNVSPKDSIERYNLLTSCLSDPEPRVRHEAIQSLWRSDGTSLIPALVDRLAVENDRIVFYTGWQALRALASTDSRRTLLADKRSGVRLASMLSLQEDHELTLDEAISLAENDEDSQVQAWAMTYALNPSPPKKMPNSQSRIEQEESISMRDLIKRAKKRKNPKNQSSIRSAHFALDLSR